MKEIKRDYVIIGAGSAGFTVAAGLDALGKDYVMISKNIGGDCTNYGCVPSKRFLHLAKEFESESRESENIKLKENVFKKIKSKIDSIREEESEFLTDKNFILGTALFDSKKSVVVKKKSGEKIRIIFKKAIISSGSSPRYTEISGVDSKKIVTNQEIFDLDKIPKTLTIIGGGPIGAELATAFSTFGTKVIIIDRRDSLQFEPKELADVIKKNLEKKGVTFYENAEIEGVNKGKLNLKSNNQLIEIEDSEVYLLAIGRTPNTKLDLEKANVDFSKYGVTVNKNLITSNKNIYAIGDVTDFPRFTHVANEHGKFVVQHILFPFRSRKNTPIPRVTYTNPFISSVGETKESGFIKKFEIDFTKSDRAIIEEREDLKEFIYVHEITGRITGASILGDFSEHLINFFTLAIKEKVSVFSLTNFIVPYPTYFSALNQLQNQFLKNFRETIKQNILKVLKNNLDRIIAALFWSITGGIVLYYLNKFNWDITELIKSFNDLLNSPFGVILYIFLYSARALIMFPALVLSVFAGYNYGFFNGALLIIVASNISVGVSYLLGRTVFSKRTNTQSNNSFVKALKNNPFQATLVARLSFFPFDLAGYIAGALKINYIKFALATAIGIIPGTLLNASFGASLENIENVSEFSIDPRFLLLSIGLAGFSILVSYLIKNRK